MRLFTNKNQSKPTELQNRRRSPIQGSARQSAFSYYSNRENTSPAAPPRVRGESANPVKTKEEYLRYILERFGVVLSICAALLLLIMSLQVSSEPKVVLLNQDTTVLLRDPSQYEHTVRATIQSSWIHRNKITIDTNRIESDLRRQFPEIADASVVLPMIGQRPTTYIQLTEPRLIVVGRDGRSFVVDENGRALVTTGAISDQNIEKLPVITDQSNLRITKGSLVLQKTAVRFIDRVYKQFSAQSIPVARMVLPAGSQQLNLYLQDQPYYVQFNLHETTALQQSGAFFALKERLAEEGKTPQEYVDVRLTGRAYYK